MLRLASGTLAPSGGQVLLGGTDVTALSAHARARLGLCHVPEGRGIFPALSVRDNLILVAPQGEELDATARAVGAFPILGRRLKQLAGTLSGGEQQMLALASAIVRRPCIVLADEASLGLAPRLVDTIFEFLAGLAAQGTALLLVEQYVARAVDLSQHIYLLDRGEIVLSGTPSEVAADALHASYLGISKGDEGRDADQ